MIPTSPATPAYRIKIRVLEQFDGQMRILRVT